MSNRSFLLGSTLEATPTKVPLTKEPCHNSPDGCINDIGCPAGGGQTDAAALEKIVRLLSRLSPEHQRSVKDMIRGLAKLEGIEAPEPAEGEPEPLVHYIPAWQNSLSRFAPRSRELYLYYVERLLANVPPPITTIAIEAYIAARPNLSPNAKKNELKAYKSFFGFLYDRDLIVSDPTAKIEYPEIVRQEKVCPSDDEVTKFLAVLAVAKNPKAELMIFLFVNTGIRFTEMATLTWGKVDFESCRINVLGKGRRARRVPMAAWLRDFLAEFGNGHSDDELLFPTASKKGQGDNSDANKMIGRLCRRAGIKRYTCHQFRHYFATHTLKGTGEKGLKSVQRMLGHASAATTLDYYIHTDEEEIAKTHEAFAPLAGDEGLIPKKGKKGGNKHG